MPYAAECVVWDQRLGDEIGVRRLHPRIGTVAKIAVGSAVKSAFLRRHLKTGSRNRHFSRRPACGPGDAHRRNQGRIRLGQYRVWARAVVDGELRGIAARQGDGGDGGEDGDARALRCKAGEKHGGEGAYLVRGVFRMFAENAEGTARGCRRVLPPPRK